MCNSKQIIGAVVGAGAAYLTGGLSLAGLASGAGFGTLATGATLGSTVASVLSPPKMPAESAPPAIAAPAPPPAPQAAKTPEQSTFRASIQAASGVGDPTALTGPEGIPKDKLLLGKATVLGA